MWAYGYLAAIDLLDRILELDPGARITAAEALAHPYLAKFADPAEEPESAPFDQTFEKKNLDIPGWKSKPCTIAPGYKIVDVLPNTQRRLFTYMVNI